MKKLVRNVLFRLAAGRSRWLGTLEQVYAARASDFYFTPALKRLRDTNRTVDHFSFHFSGQTHLKFIDGSREVNVHRSSSIPQANLGYAPFLGLRLNSNILPEHARAEGEGDIVFDLIQDRRVWFEMNFVSSSYLLGNDLGFGTPLACVTDASSYLGRHVILVGHLPNTDKLMLQFTYGRVDRLNREQELEVSTYKEQFLHDHKISKRA